jgi:TolA-binding protein
MNFRTQTIKLISTVFLLFILSGCSVWENLTTYFNLYYNTSALFEEAEKEILPQKRDIFSNEPLVIPGTAKSNLVKVVEKASKLLQFYSTSSYVDEALMMLGKSFYYQNNYQKAQRKFEELLATNPDDETTTEAKLWIAKCLFEMREITQALTLNEEVRKKAIEEDYENIVKDSYVQEIKHRIKAEDFTLAISLANEFADNYKDDVVRAQIYYELGNLYQQINDNENAITAYEKVFDNEPDFDLEIAATIKYANSLRKAGKTEQAIQVFEDIRDEDKFSTSYNEIDFEIGRTYVVLGEFHKAYDQFRMVDTTYRSTSFAAQSNFELAELYRTKFMNYDSAAYFYSKSVAANLSKEYTQSAKDKNQLFVKYSKIRKDINKFDKQLYYSQNPDLYTFDSLNYVSDSLKILNDYLAQKELQDLWQADTLFNSKNLNLKDSTLIKDSIFVRDSLLKVDSLIQAGLFDPADTVGLKKSLMDTLKVRNLAKLKDPKNPANILKQLQGGVKLDSVKFKKNPPQKLRISIDSAKTILAKNSLELGNLFLAELNVPDSAYKLYTKIIADYPSPIYYPNTLYALGSYYLTVDNKAKADSLFNIIYENYKDKSIVNAAANKLNMPLIDLKYDPAKDLYASAEDLMLDGKFSQSINNFYTIYKLHPKSSIAPQALYTTGWILENELSLSDSAVSVYDTLIAKFPGSVYVKNVSKKVTAYKQEKFRIQKAIQDSLAALNKPVDTTLVVQNEIEETENEITDDAFGMNKDENQNLATDDLQENNDLKQSVSVTKKKLEPLWDPRKHFN